MSSLTLFVSFDFLMITVLLSQRVVSVFVRTFWLHVSSRGQYLLYTVSPYITKWRLLMQNVCKTHSVKRKKKDKWRHFAWNTTCFPVREGYQTFQGFYRLDSVVGTTGLCRKPYLYFMNFTQFERIYNTHNTNIVNHGARRWARCMLVAAV